MNTEYKKEPGKKYLVLFPENPEKEFVQRMLSENKISGLLHFEKRMFNGEIRYFYDVSGKHRVQDASETVLLSGKKIRGLLQSLYCVAGELPLFFLEVNGLVLDMEYIFEDTRGFYFCYDPSSDDKEEERLEWFSSQLLDKIDNDDEDAVAYGYRFYKTVRDENKAILQVLEEVLSEKDEKQEPETEMEEDIYKEEEEDVYESIFLKRADIRTLIYFGLMLIVSLGYLSYLFCIMKDISIERISDINSGFLALIYIFLSILGLATAFVDIDIRGKK